MLPDPESQTVLAKSLDSIDAMRRRMLLAGYVTVAGTFAAFLWFNHVTRTADNVNSVISAAVLALICVIAWSTFALAIVIARMTRRILRAIELTKLVK